ncbi:prepilin-type N-terminal cleavage/methylation domain-containing protein [bacterium]|nr:prepilin-type N-terminal cleavage/methylation domain-containing protein [bacterium]
MTRNKKGFTLVEILIVMAIGSMLTVVLYQIFTQIWNSYNKGSVIIALDRSSRIVLEYLKKDLREACTTGHSEYFGLLVTRPKGGKSVDCWGEKTYSHGTKLSFHRFKTAGTPNAPNPDDRRPTADLIEYTFEENYTHKGQKCKAVIRTVNRGGKKILATFPEKSKADLYFVKFSIGEITPKMAKDGIAPKTMVGTGGKNFIRISFVAEIRGNKRVEHVPLMLVIGPRQINSYLKDVAWNTGSSSSVRIDSELVP